MVFIFQLLASNKRLSCTNIIHMSGKLGSEVVKVYQASCIRIRNKKRYLHVLV